MFSLGVSLTFSKPRRSGVSGCAVLGLLGLLGALMAGLAADAVMFHEKDHGEAEDVPTDEGASDTHVPPRDLSLL